MNLSDYIATARPQGISRVVVVQASIDGTDNTRLVDALKSANGLAARGVATVEPGANLEVLHAAGVRGLRIQHRANLGKFEFGRLPALSRDAAAVGWHIDLNIGPAEFEDVQSYVAQLPEGQLIVLDHMGHIDPSHPADIERLCRLLDSGRVWIKTSLTRITRRPGDYLDLSGIAAKLASNFPEQCVWGSDWPHVMTAPPVPEIAPMIEFFRKTLNEDQFKALMWKNPERLYGF